MKNFASLANQLYTIYIIDQHVKYSYILYLSHHIIFFYDITSSGIHNIYFIYF